MVLFTRRSRVSSFLASTIVDVLAPVAEREHVPDGRRRPVPLQRLRQLRRYLYLSWGAVVLDHDVEDVAGLGPRLGHDGLGYAEHHHAAHAHDGAAIWDAVEAGLHRDPALAAEGRDDLVRDLDQVPAAAATRRPQRRFESCPRHGAKPIPGASASPGWS